MYTFVRRLPVMTLASGFFLSIFYVVALHDELRIYSRVKKNVY